MAKLKSLATKFLLLAAVALLSACASLGGGSAGYAQQNPWGDLPPYEWPPYQQFEAGSRSDLAANDAEKSLLAEADAHYADKRLGASAASLERGLRLSPRSALLWYRLAALRAADGQYMSASRLAEKAQSLLTENSSPRLKQWVNWLNEWLLVRLQPSV